MSHDHVGRLFDHPASFFSMCMGMHEDEEEGVDYYDATPNQIDLLTQWDAHQHLIVNKYRQAKISTPIAMQILRDAMYLEGIQARLVAEREYTAKDLFERIMLAYKNLPDGIRAPMPDERRLGTTELHFWHGGSIKILTAGADAPAIGRSIDRLLVTEFGEARWQRQAATYIFPGIAKRKHARSVIESTPGKLGSHYWTMWTKALEGKGRFHPRFYLWYTDLTCVPNWWDEAADDAFEPTPDELAFAAAHPGCGYGQLAFKRENLDGEFGGDERLFSARFPGDKLDGWLGSDNPVLPEDEIRRRIGTAIQDPPDIDERCGGWVIEPPEPGYEYLITADPTGYGKTGDPAAFMVWRGFDGAEVAGWEGREDPGRFADRLIKAAVFFNGAILAVESNHPACVQSLRDKGAKRLFWTSRHHPGWCSTEKSLREAEAKLVRMLRDDEIDVRTLAALRQMLTYDGALPDQHGTNPDGTRHHFDRARCVVIAADMLSRRRWGVPDDTKARGYIDEPDAPDAPDGFDPDAEPPELRVRDLDKWEEDRKASRDNPFVPPSQRGVWR